MDTKVIEKLIDDINDFGKPRILVIGDLFLDEYVWGKVERISPEAPIQVLSVTNRKYKPGAAGCVYMNLQTLGAQANIMAVLGDDAMGKELKSQLAEKKHSANLIFTEKGRNTTLKTRIIAGIQHVLRVDCEDSTPPAKQTQEKMLKTLTEKIDKYAVIIISDYDKGLITKSFAQSVIKLAKKYGVMVVVDPARHGDYEKYHGADVITPNRKETELATGIAVVDEKSAKKASRRLVKDLNLQAAFITLDKDGIAVMDKADSFKVYPTKPIEVYDVTGAGDMVISIVGMGLANNLPFSETARLANIAAGIEVERIGATQITKQEMLDTLYNEMFIHSSKIKSLPEMLTIRSDLADKKRKVVFTNGCFDILHVGHIKFLQFAKKQGDVLIVGLNSDGSVKKNKGNNRPIVSEEERANIIAALDIVNYVVIFNEPTPAEIIKHIKPDVLIKGEDWREKGVVGSDFVKSYGGKVVLAPLLEGKSTTDIISRVLNSYNRKG